jgi:transitional endoplasmic reticulum ATPase
MIDPAITRPGRIDRNVEVEIPDEEARKKILEVHTRDMPLADDVDLDELAEKTEDFVGSDIESLCREAAMISLRADPEDEEVSMDEFKDALDEVVATATDENRDIYRQMARKMKDINSEDKTPDYYA